MQKDYLFPVILQDGKQFALRHHIRLYSGYSVTIINRLIENVDIATHLIGFQVYIDVDKALTVLSNGRFQPRRAAFAASKILNEQEQADLFS